MGMMSVEGRVMGSKGQEGTQGCNIIRAIIGALCGCVGGDRQAHHIYFQSANPKR